MNEPAQAGAPRRPATPFEVIGDEAGLRRLVDAFYDIMEREPAFARLRSIHSADLGPMRARLADYLTQWTGGPHAYAERHPGRGCIVSAHETFKIDAAQARDWMACMRRAFDETGVPAEFRGMVEPVLVDMCEGLRNDKAG